MDLIKDILIIIVAIPIFIWAFMNAIPIFLFIIGGLSHMLSNLWDKNHILMFKDGAIEGSIFAAVKICVMFFIIFISAFIDINTVRVLNLINGFFYSLLFLIFITAIIRLKIKYIIGFISLEEVIGTLGLLFVNAIFS